MIDDRTGSTIAANRYSGEYIWTAADNRFAWEALLGVPPGSDGISYLAAPARATDLTGLPPTLMATAAMDLFIDENLDYARRLMEAGVTTEVIVAPGAFHGFQMIAPAAAVSQRFNNFCNDALRRAFGS
jgi:triacylglycerol lipase